MRRTTILGYNMQKQSARRSLVIAVYALLAALLVAGWLIDRLHTSGFYIDFAAFFINYFVFGGYGPSGLIKPFTGRGPRAQPIPTSLIELELRMAGVPTERSTDEYRNDERELQRRDRAFYQAYPAVTVMLLPIWLVAQWEIHPPHWVPVGLLPILLDWIALPGVLLTITLPQAILLWTESDLDTDSQEPSAQTAVKLIP